MKTAGDVRPSWIAGQWYPGDAGELAASVDAWLAGAAPPALADVVALVAPHAGHRYSGALAAWAFALARGLEPELVAVVGPMHSPVSGVVLSSSQAAWCTPLGTVPVDTAALAEIDASLQAALGTGVMRMARDGEHAVEIELPFLQRALRRPFSLLPLMVHDPGREVARALGAALAGIARRRRVLLVASTDLSHGEPDVEARRLDAEMIRRIETLEPDLVLAAEDQGAGYACGAGALAAVMWAAREMGASRACLLRYATSGDVTGDRTRVVGYAALALVRGPG